MPTARPITVTMFTAKTETSNQAPIARVSAMATTMATTARASGIMAAATAPKTSSRMTSAMGTPISSAAPQVGLGEVARLESPRRAARHRDREAVLAVGVADQVVQRPDVGLGVARASGEGHQDRAWRSRPWRRAPSPSRRMRRSSRRHRHLACRRRGDGGHAGDMRRPDRLDLLGELGDAALEGAVRVADPARRGAHHHDLGVGRRTRQTVGDQPLDLLRLRRAQEVVGRDRTSPHAM